MGNPPGRTQSDPNVEISDLDGDGLPDLLVTGAASGQFQSYLNQDGTTWKDGVDWAASQSPSASLGSVGVQLADLDGDGAIDLVVKSGTNDFRYFAGSGATTFRAPVSIATVPSFSFEDPDVKLADMDGDRRIDAVITTADGLAIVQPRRRRLVAAPARGLRRPPPSAPLLRRWPHPTLRRERRPGRRLLLPHPRLARLLAGSRSRRLEPPQTAAGVPTWDPSSPLATWELRDLNGDGWVDFVHVGVDEVDVALAHAEGQFDLPQTIGHVPTVDANTVVRFADMNASGTTDIVWIDVAGDAVRSPSGGRRGRRRTSSSARRTPWRS